MIQHWNPDTGAFIANIDVGSATWAASDRVYEAKVPVSAVENLPESHYVEAVVWHDTVWPEVAINTADSGLPLPRSSLYEYYRLRSVELLSQYAGLTKRVPDDPLAMAITDA